ncbi:MAG: T9SS type A sorting domain-containing protein [Flavobacteriales bacterium]|nr:T9SS type A sorting domain-containing protein [Flavobacteriales bacterium]MBP6698669.1 T9SS type A sorting domain-containing protein [Flavobacteriales bacterium]
MHLLHFPLALLVLIAHSAMAQTDLAQWVLLSNDSGVTFQGSEDLVQEANGGLLAGFSHGAAGITTRLRFVRMDADMAPLQQWDIDADTMEVRLKRMVPLANGSIACFGRYETMPFYLLLDPTGQPVMANTYTNDTSGGIWNDAVLADTGSFQVCGLNSVGSQGSRVRLNMDGSVQNSDLFLVGASLTPFHAMCATADGGFAYVSGVNTFGPEAHLKVVRTDALGNLAWVRNYTDTASTHSAADIFELPDGSLRVITRYQAASRAGFSMLSLGSDGAVLQVRRRLTLPPHGLLFNLGGEAVMLGDSAIMAFGKDSNDDTYVHIVGTDGNDRTLAFPQLPVSTLVKGLPGDNHDVYLMGTGPGLTANSGTVALLMIHASTDLTFCTADAFPTTQGGWTPRIDTAYTVSAPVWMITDVLPTLTMQPGSATVEVTCVSTSVEVPDNGTSFTLVPNPATDRVRISGTDLEQVELFDATGRKVLEERIMDALSPELDVHALPPGFYHVRVWNGALWMGGSLVRE